MWRGPYIVSEVDERKLRLFSIEMQLYKSVDLWWYTCTPKRTSWFELV